MTTNNLANFDFQILIDTSGSMGSNDPGKIGTRLHRAKESVIGLVGELSQVDEDGLDIIFFGGETVTHFPGVKSTVDVETAFNRRASGGTPTTKALAKAFEVVGKSDKPDFIIVITDGEPNNHQAVKVGIVKQANSQANDADLTILFIQIGDDASADSYPSLAALINDATAG